MLVDVHCHLNYLNNPREEIEKARKEGIDLFFTNSEDKTSFLKNLKLREFEGVYVFGGIHPVNLLEMSPEEVKDFLKTFEEKKDLIVGIGEVGLDYKYAKTEGERKKQENIYRFFLRKGKEDNLPIEVHSRWAQRQVLEIAIEEKAENVLFHWYTSSRKLIKKLKDNGYYFSVGWAIFFEETKKVLEEVGPENLLLETDTPITIREKEMRPVLIKQIFEEYCKLFSLEKKEGERLLEKNLKGFLGRRYELLRRNS